MGTQAPTSTDTACRLCKGKGTLPWVRRYVKKERRCRHCGGSGQEPIKTAAA